MHIAYITAGAAGMYCGSCMHDNTLVSALIARGHDALLVPTYTPIRTDENDVSRSRVFFGGINVYLQQKLGLFRHTPWLLDRLMDFPPLLRWVSRFAVRTEAEQLGELAVSMLQGEHGFQSKEVAKLARWLSREIRPDLINLTNVLLSGVVREIRKRLRVPILATLQGDDIFLEALPESYRKTCLDLLRANCKLIDGFISTSAYYADFMSAYLDIPREKIDVVYPGLNLNGHGGPRTPTPGTHTLGYFARICPEKGLHVLIDAFRRLKQMPNVPPCRLRISGWLGAGNVAYLEEQKKLLDAASLQGEYEHIDSPSHADKVRFLQSLDILSVPTVYREPKGLYILEALANGVPVVQPRHGSFPELIETTGGGILVASDDALALAEGIRDLLEDRARREKLGQQGKDAVFREFNAQRMAERTEEVYRRYMAVAG